MYLIILIQLPPQIESYLVGNTVLNWVNVVHLLKWFSLRLFFYWQHITPDSYIPCLTDLCKALWEVMLSYHCTIQWHEEHDNKEGPPTQGNSYPIANYLKYTPTGMYQMTRNSCAKWQMCVPFLDTINQGQYESMRWTLFILNSCFCRITKMRNVCFPWFTQGVIYGDVSSRPELTRANIKQMDPLKHRYS